MLRALRHDCRLQPAPQIVRQLVQLLVAVDLDRLAGGIADHVTVVAPRQVVFKLGLGPIVERAIEVVG